MLIITQHIIENIIKKVEPKEILISQIWSLAKMTWLILGFIVPLLFVWVHFGCKGRNLHYTPKSIESFSFRNCFLVTHQHHWWYIQKNSEAWTQVKVFNLFQSTQKSQWLSESVPTIITIIVPLKSFIYAPQNNFNFFFDPTFNFKFFFGACDHLATLHIFFISKWW